MKLASTRKPCVEAGSTVRFGTDSVNSFREQIYRSLVSVAPKPHAPWPDVRRARPESVPRIDNYHRPQ